MRVAALYSGGKDSNIALYKSYKEHEIVCLVTLVPEYDDSMLFHYPNASYTRIQADSLGLPIIQRVIKKGYDEYIMLKDILLYTKAKYDIEGFVSGAISSMYQRSRFDGIAEELGLMHLAPCWGEDQYEHMKELLTNNIKAMITSVSAHGLDEHMLGKVIDGAMLERLHELSKRYGFNLAFEGGEAETFVLDMPLFNYGIKIKDYVKHWDGVRGYIEFIL